LIRCVLAQFTSTNCRSTILSKTSIPKWNNEEWIVRNVPSNAKLLVSIYGIDDDKIVDNYIGEFEILNLVNYDAPQGGHPIIGSFGRHNGRFHLSIQSRKSSNESDKLPRYTFDGPCRYSRYDSLVDDHRDDSIYSTWKIQLRRIPFFFPSNDYQESNQQYRSSRNVFNTYPILSAAQSIMKQKHQLFYERTLKSNENGRLTSTDDLWKLIFLDRLTQKIKPRAYNYIIDDNTWQFSEISHQFFTDYEIKHAHLANSSECLRYAGEFHLRPRFGWNRMDDQWELVLDNASGTYSPNANLLDNLKKLLLFNFPGLNITVYDYKDPMLRDSLEQLELAMKKYKYTTTTINKRNLPYSSST
jgi:hypothetical protein